MKIKCDTCTHNAISDERDVGAGYVLFCNKYHWSGDSDDSDEGYYNYRDDCVDYESKGGTIYG